MSFTSFSFALFFLVLTLLYYTVAGKKQWQLLLIAGYFFYACADPRYLIFILVTTASAYLVTMRFTALRRELGRWFDEHPELTREERKRYKEKTASRCRKWLLLAVLLNFGILFTFKYLNFFLVNLDSLFGLFGGGLPVTSVRLLLPLGLSFYIFQTIGYVADIYFGKYEAERNPFRLALFVSFFPQLLQGPIGRYNLMAPTLFASHAYDSKAVRFGLQRMLWGYFKKIVIADRLIKPVSTIGGAPEEYGGVFVLLGMLLYAAQLYCDFTGGIDITIGSAEVLGVRLSENFNRPFFSKSVAEYWRRWHITLGTWFKDYTFYPLSTSKAMMKLSKWTKGRFGPAVARRVPVYLSTVILWLATGAWHGAKWNFIVWGLGNCLVILISQELTPLYRRFYERFPKLHRSRFWDGVQVLRTNGIMCLLRTLDCYASPGAAFFAIGTIFTRMNGGALTTDALLELGLKPADIAVTAVGVLIVFAVSMAGRSGSVREKLARLPAGVRVLLFGALFFSILVFGAYGIGYDAGQFIYTQF